MAKSTRVVGVEVGQDDPPHLLRGQAQSEQLLVDLVPLGQVEPERPAVVRVDREVAGIGGLVHLAGVDEDQSLRVFDRPGVNGQRRRPLRVPEDV